MILKINSSSSQKTLEAAVEEATALFADGTKVEDTQKLVKQVEVDIGPIAFVNYNIGAQVGNRTVDKTSYRILN